MRAATGAPGSELGRFWQEHGRYLVRHRDCLLLHYLRLSHGIVLWMCRLQILPGLLRLV
jgi:hypothetical protein